MEEQMLSYFVIKCHTDERWGSSLGLLFLKLLQFTRATSRESSQHKLSLLLQKSCLGTETSLLDFCEVQDKSSLPGLEFLPSLQMIISAVGEFSSVLNAGVSGISTSINNVSWSLSGIEILWWLVLSGVSTEPRWEGIVASFSTVAPKEFDDSSSDAKHADAAQSSEQIILLFCTSLSGE